MSISQQIEPSVLRRFFLGFRGTSLPRELRYLLSRGLGGVAIYRRNWGSLSDLRALTSQIRRAANGPVLIGIDQEGGTRFSLPLPFTQWPSPEQLGRLGDAQLVGKMARAMAKELRAAGVNLDFAPMLDLHVNPESPVTKIRSYGRDAKLVAALGRAVVRGMSREGVLTCAKHFPGHGDAVVDPHHDLPTFRGSIERLHKRELVPFRATIRAGVPLVMTAHILLPRIDRRQPASISNKALRGILRRKLRFRGVILADDLGMGAIARRMDAGDAAVASLRAGSDVVMLCHDWHLVRPAIEAVEEAYHRGTLSEDDWRGTDARIAGVLRRAASNCAPTSSRVIGCRTHRKLADNILQRWRD